MAANGVTDAGEQEVTHTEDYEKLLAYGIDEKVASELDIIYESGLLTHGDLDERALDALKEFPADGGVSVLKEFKESNLEHVSNKSAYLCGVMKTYRHKNKMQGPPGSAAEKKPGPDETKIKEILDRTGYELDYTTGQRKYGGPPPNWDANQPGAGHEVFCGKIPKEIFEDELIPLFEKCGKIWDLRLMMDPMTGLNRGFCFTTFCDKDGAHEAVKQLDNYEIKPGKRLKVNISVANLRLFVGNIPKSKSKDEIQEEFKKLTEHLTDVIIYSSPDDSKKRNRGFAFLEYSTHKDASVAKRRIGNGRTRVFGCDIIVDWADPQEEPDHDVMNKVKVLYVRNLKTDVTEEQLKEQFTPYGKIERVKKIKDYGFVHFEERDCALKAMEALNGTKLGDSEMEVSLAKPPSENKQKEKRRRMQGMFDDFWGAPPSRMSGGGGPGGPRGGRMMGGRPPPMGSYGGDFGGYNDYGGYCDFGGGYADDFYDYGYEDEFMYGYSPRGRGGRGGGGPPPIPRGRGAMRGMRGGSMGPRGGVGGPRGGPRGGAMGPPRGMGGRGGGRGRGGPPRGAAVNPAGAPVKRKAGTELNQGQSKKRNNQDNWGVQPIAQQPLGDQQFYQDSYGEQWN